MQRLRATSVDKPSFSSSPKCHVPGEIPGLIVMGLADDDGKVDRLRKRVVVVLNATQPDAEFHRGRFPGVPLSLHPLQRISVDPAVRSASFNKTLGAFSVPGLTAAVFWSNRPAAEQIQLLLQDVDNLIASGAITGGRGNALEAKLQAALQQAQNGNPHPRRQPARRLRHAGHGLRQPGLPDPGRRPGADRERVAGDCGGWLRKRVTREPAFLLAAVFREGGRRFCFGLALKYK